MPGGNISSLNPAMSSSQQDAEDATITLPPSLFGTLAEINLPTIGVFFGRYETPTLFPVGRNITNGRETQVGSQVIAATVGQNLPIQNLSEPVIITLKTQINQETSIRYTAVGSEMCVSWDFDTQRWTANGCSTSVGQDGIVTCHCNHLTNFAVLVVKNYSLLTMIIISDE